MRTKLDLVKNNIKLLTPEPDVVILTETWLCQNIKDNELGLVGYNIIRKDRYDLVSAPCGGGVLIAVKEKFLFNIISNSDIQSSLQSANNLISDDINVSNEDNQNQITVDIEQVFIELSLDKKIIIGAFYASPSEDVDGYLQHAQSIEILKNKYESHEFILLGDYNLPKTIWYNYNELSDALNAQCDRLDWKVRENVELIVNTFSYFGLYEHYPTHPGKGYTLDLAFSTFEEREFRYVSSLDYLVPIDAAHHEPAFFSVNTGLQ